MTLEEEREYIKIYQDWFIKVGERFNKIEKDLEKKEGFLLLKKHVSSKETLHRQLERIISMIKVINEQYKLIESKSDEFIDAFLYMYLASIDRANDIDASIDSRKSTLREYISDKSGFAASFVKGATILMLGSGNEK